MPDLLDRIRSEMSTRLAELRPLVDEQRRLEAALHALGDATSNAPAALASPAAPAKRPAPKPVATRRKRAARGANREAVLGALKDRPGATSAELSNVSGVDRNTLYGLLARLVKDGALQTHSLPTGRTGYSLAEPRPQDSSSAAPVAHARSATDENAAASTTT
jgi:hypothetical protein